MAHHGNVILFASDGSPPTVPRDTALRIASLLEDAGLVRKGVSSGLEPIVNCSVTFENFFESGKCNTSNYAYVVIQPDQLTGKLEELVFLITNDGEIELPCIEITVLSHVVPVADFMSGRTLGQAFAAVEFSYEDVRLSEEIHRIRDDNHPFVSALGDVLAAPVKYAVVCY